MERVGRTEEMEPIEFCRIYSVATEGAWGYKAKWNALLTYVLGKSARAIERWGPQYEKCPYEAKKTLGLIHALKTTESALAEAQQTLKAYGLDGPLQ